MPAFATACQADLAVMSIDDEGNADEVAVPAGNLKPV
jgi:hypothetical protein